MQSVGIKGFMDGKLGSTSMAFWDWHGYMSSTYSNLLKLFSMTNMMQCLLTYIQPGSQRRTESAISGT